TDNHSSFVSLAYTNSPCTAVPNSFEPLSFHHGCSGSTTYTSPQSRVRRPSSLVTNSSWSFSPGRIPLTSRSTASAIAAATAATRHRLGEGGDPHRRDLRQEDLAAFHLRQRERHALDGLGGRAPEAGHAVVGDGQATVTFDLLADPRPRRARRADDVAVTHAR